MDPHLQLEGKHMGQALPSGRLRDPAGHRQAPGERARRIPGLCNRRGYRRHPLGKTGHPLPGGRGQVTPVANRLANNFPEPGLVTGFALSGMLFPDPPKFGPVRMLGLRPEAGGTIPGGRSN